MNLCLFAILGAYQHILPSDYRVIVQPSKNFWTFFVLILLSVNVASAEFSFGQLDDAGCDHIYNYQACVTVTLTGRINRGDTEKLKGLIDRISSTLSQISGKKTRVGKIQMDSNGGDLLEAIKIGRMIRAQLINTQITHDSQCHSSCVIAFAGGNFRAPVGPTGIHSFYSEEFISSKNHAHASSKYNDISDLIEAYLKEVRVSEALLDHMKRVPHYTMHLMTHEELKEYGLLGIDPVYAQINPKYSIQRPK